MPKHDDALLGTIQSSATDAEALEALDAYADSLQAVGEAKREEFVRLTAEHRRDPGRKIELIKSERRLKELRDELGDAWCDLVVGHTAAVEFSVLQSYGELLGRLDAFTTVSQATADQLDFAAELWWTRKVTDDFLTNYYRAVFDSEPIELVKLKDWEEHFRKRLGDWLMVCIDFRGGRDGRRSRGVDKDLLLTEFIRLVKGIAAPTSVCRVAAPILNDEKPIPRAYLFEGPHAVLSLTLTVLD